MTTEREPCLKRVSCLGYWWSDSLGFLSHFWYLFSEDFYVNAKHLKNTVLYWKDEHKKVNCSFACPLCGICYRNQQRRLKQEKTLEPQAVNHEITTLFTSSFYFLWHISVVPSQVFPKVLQEENRPSKRHWCILRPGPLGSKLRYHRVYRNLIQTSIIRVLPACPHSCYLQKNGRENFHEYISTRFYLLNFHFGNV